MRLRVVSLVVRRLSGRQSWLAAIALVLACALALGTTASAALIGVANHANSAYPRTDGVGGAMTFDAVSRVLTINVADAMGSSPFSSRFNPSSGPNTSAHLTAPTPNSLSISIKVLDSAGQSYAGNGIAAGLAADFVLTGTYDVNGNGTIESGEHGVLLTGSLTKFGFANPPGTAQDKIDFRFAVTGGLWAPVYAGKDIGVSDILRSNTWPVGGSFAASFSASGTVNTLPLP